MAESMADSVGIYTSGNEMIVAECTKGWRDLVYIEYPGIVENEEKAFETLGGMETITKVCQQEKVYNRLELRYRPDNIYCKPAVARASKTCCVAIKVRRIRSNKSSWLDDVPDSSCKDDKEGTDYLYNAELLGLVRTCFEFPGMVDYQVIQPGLNNMTHKGLPLEPHPKLIMTELMDESCFSLDVPVFLPPLIFSKLDKPSKFAYKPDTRPQVGVKSVQAKKMLPGRGRAKRCNYSYNVPFTQEEVPQAPHPDTPSSNHPKLKVLKQLFEERPVWPRVALQAKLKITATFLRVLLPLVGYYFTSGPWKKLWLKFGYDPRVDPSGKIYQSLDFRVPKALESTVVAPSQGYQERVLRPLGVGGEMEGWRYKKLQVSEEESLRLAEERLRDTVEDIDESVYIFSPDTYPHQRQQLYQLCDLRDDTLQAIIHNNDGKETKCHEITGWCEEDTYDKIRKGMIDLIIAKAQREGHNIEKPVSKEEMEPDVSGTAAELDPESL